MTSTPDADEAFDVRLSNRAERFTRSNERRSKSFERITGRQIKNVRLEMKPEGINQPHGKIPNTPAMVSLISFLLGGAFVFSMSVFAKAKVTCLWEGNCDATRGLLPPRLGFFMSAWSAFHWGEFIVTSQWNRDQVSVDCECI